MLFYNFFILAVYYCKEFCLKIDNSKQLYRKFVWLHCIGMYQATLHNGEKNFNIYLKLNINVFDISRNAGITGVTKLAV